MRIKMILQLFSDKSNSFGKHEINVFVPGHLFLPLLNLPVGFLVCLPAQSMKIPYTVKVAKMAGRLRWLAAKMAVFSNHQILYGQTSANYPALSVSSIQFIFTINIKEVVPLTFMTKTISIKGMISFSQNIYLSQ